MSEHTEYQQKVAEALATKIVLHLVKGRQAHVRDLFTAVLAAEGVVDPRRVAEIQAHSKASDATYEVLSKALSSYKTKVERLEAEALLHRTFGIDQRKAGMEQAAKSFDDLQDDWLLGRNAIQYRIRAKIKQESGNK